ncbi:MAG TPA: ATP-binding cassette domain-containing protein [Pseudoxanthomonas sp.]|nr:ATP-binding cassette domain-containing protein [Pseudoxanthomonas sp.]
MNAPPAALQLCGLGLRYPDGAQALQALDLSVPRGQFCVVLGSSGSGKSSLLRLINGLARPTSGHVLLSGERLRNGDLRTRGRHMATIHQGIDLVPRLSVLDNVLTGGVAQLPLWRALAGAFDPPRQRRACRLLQEVGLDESQIYRRASALSGGQQQRVGIARAFMSAPSVVLADEPVSSLDPNTSRAVLALLRRAAGAHGATVLCSLHQVDLAQEFADRIVGLRQGRLVLDTDAPRALEPGALEQLYGRNGSGTARVEAA